MGLFLILCQDHLHKLMQFQLVYHFQMQLDQLVKYGHSGLFYKFLQLH